MKHLIVFCVVLAMGCGIPPEAKTQASLSRTRAEAFVKLLDAGQTTRQQEQDFIRASAGMFAAIDKALGGAE